MTHIIGPLRAAVVATYRRTAIAGLTLVILVLPACIATTVAARRITLGSDSGRVVTQPSKAQLVDGSIVLFREGFRVEGREVLGTGWRYDPTLRDSVSVSGLPMDSVAGVVAFGTSYDAAKSVGMSVAAGIGLLFALAIAFIAGCAATKCLRD